MCIQWRTAAHRALLSRANNLGRLTNNFQARIESRCARLRQDVYEAKAKAAATLMEILDKQELEDVRSIDAYERDCLSRAAASSASHRTSVDVSAAASKLMLDEKRAYVEKHAQLAADQSLQNAIDELINLRVHFKDISGTCRRLNSLLLNAPKEDFAVTNISSERQSRREQLCTQAIQRPRGLAHLFLLGKRGHEGYIS